MDAKEDDKPEEFHQSFGPVLSLQEAIRGEEYFWSQCELRWRGGDRNSGCPRDTYRTNIPRVQKKNNLFREWNPQNSLKTK